MKWNPLRLFRRDKESGTPTVRGALVFSTAQQYTKFLITFPSIMILSRLLTPAEVGVYSVALTFMNVVHMLRDMGTSEYLVQAPELSDDIARSAFTINLILAWFLAAVLFLASPLMADFFGEPGVGSVMRILTITFILLPIGATVNAILARKLLFEIRYKIALGNVLTQNVVTVVLAWYGFGYYSPAWGAVAGMAANIAGCFYWAGEHRIRGLGLSQWRDVTQFGVKSTAGTMMNQLGIAAPDFVIGRMLGMADVGMFSRGVGIVRMFRQNLVGAIGAVSYSTFAKTYRDGGNVGHLYLRSITYVTGIGWPFLGFASIMAYPLIHILFGDQWDRAVPILRFMAVYVAINLIILQYQQLLTAVGRVGLGSLWVAIWQVGIVIMLVVTSLYGLVVVAASYVPCSIVLVICIITGLSSVTNITYAQYLRALAPSAIVTACALVPTAISQLVYPPGPDNIWAPTIVAGFAWLAGVVVGGKLAGHPVWYEIQGFIKQRLRQRRNVISDS